jgi:superfamily I DNA/RNA helicase
MMRRVAWLLDSGEDPESILVCTFTRTAVDDLRTALKNLFVDGANRVQATTLHSFCFRVLLKASVLELTCRAPRPLAAYEERFLLEDLTSEIFGGIQAKEDRLQAFSAVWARLQHEEPGWPSEFRDQEFEKELTAWLRFHAAMLIGELVPLTLRYLRDNPTAPERNAFDNVLVDEYQDLNKAEQVLVDLLGESAQTMILGDGDQSIYSFKYAHPEGISTFEISHPGTQTERLSECRRLPQRVVEIANALIAHNVQSERRALNPRPDNPEGEILVLQWQTLEEETEGIARLIKERIDAGSVKAGEILVLAPQRRMGYAIRDKLNSLGINAHSVFREQLLEGNPKTFDRCRPQEAVTLLKLLVNPEDRVALRCWCGFGSSTLGRGEWNKLRQHCESTGKTPKEALEHLADGSYPATGMRHITERFRMLRSRLAELAELRDADLIDALLPANAEWAAELRDVASALPADEFTADELREWLEGVILRQDAPIHVDYVRVMSLYKAKGLTANLVAVVGCVDGLIPFLKDRPTIEEQDRALEEQRRLFYVALTRVRQTLILSNFSHISFKQTKQMGIRSGGYDATGARVIASRFLQELGPTSPRPLAGKGL